jgi:hypothetical protein
MRGVATGGNVEGGSGWVHGSIPGTSRVTTAGRRLAVRSYGIQARESLERERDGGTVAALLYCRHVVARAQLTRTRTDRCRTR